MEPISADHAVELADTVLRERDLNAVRSLGDSLDSIAEEQMTSPRASLRSWASFTFLPLCVQYHQPSSLRCQVFATLGMTSPG